MADHKGIATPLPRWRKIPPLAAAAFIVMVLVVFNLSNWRMMRLLERSKEEDLSRRVSSVSKVIAESLTEPAPPGVLLTLVHQTPESRDATLDVYPDTPEYETLATRLSRLKASSGLAQILLLTLEGDVVADSNYRFLTGEPLPFAIDTQYLQGALRGSEATTPLYEWEGEHFERDYQAITDSDGTTIGVVMSSISADYLQGMRQVRTQVLRLWLLSSVFLVLLGIWLYRTFAYVARLERRALQKVRVEAMGALAGGVAHELRNPLAIIRALAEEIEADQPAINRSVENSRDIIAETQRLSDLVTHFLSLSRSPEAAEAQRVGLNDEVERVVQLMRKSSPPEVIFEMDLPRENLNVQGDARALRQLLLNLLVNAREALHDCAGRVDITLRVKRHFAELRIHDSGPGIAPKDLGRVFEPFFTTRPTGTGLGLAISRGIAENMGGELNLESSKGNGTTAIVTLPLAPDPAA